MSITFKLDINWKKRSGLWIIYVLFLIISNVITMVYQRNVTISSYIVFGALTILFVAFGVYKILYYFNLHRKVYVELQEKQLSIYRGNLLSRRTVPFDQMKRAVLISKMILIKLKTDKEVQIHTEWISERDSQALQRELKNRLGENAIFS
ncbi:hypothetical protein [Gracilibacillus boraciitolerans]|uniref:hypothetical protein n=1 Tax=Gracilibacillus boraciitolerans TaxID=307521 RepID=UPI00054F066C|nr:hypothetical protein [Gracilibacillus boraciitolerans]